MTDVMKYDDGAGNMIGLEDFDLATESTTPRIRIVHSDGVYEDNQSGVQTDSFDGIILGLVKQRVLWPPEMEEDAPPLCRSYDFKTGYPNPATFPLKQSGLKITLSDGVTASCADCKLQEWGSNPKTPAGEGTPWCTEQHVLAVLADITGEGNFVPSLVTFQRSGLKTSRQYLGSFARSKKPTFTVTTKFGLNAQKRGSVKFAVPTLTRGEVVPEDEYPTLAEMYLGIRAFLQAPRGDSASSAATGDDTLEEGF